MRTLLVIVVLALWPGVGYAQPALPPGVVDGMVDCLAQRLGPAFVVTRLEPVSGAVMIDGEPIFNVSRQDPHGPRSIPIPKVGGDEVDFWFDDDPLAPPVLLQYSAGIPHGARDISHDPLYAVGVVCFDRAYPRVP